MQLCSPPSRRTVPPTTTTTTHTSIRSPPRGGTTTAPGKPPPLALTLASVPASTTASTPYSAKRTENSLRMGSRSPTTPRTPAATSLPTTLSIPSVTEARRSPRAPPNVRNATFFNYNFFFFRCTQAKRGRWQFYSIQPANHWSLFQLEIHLGLLQGT